MTADRRFAALSVEATAMKPNWVSVALVVPSGRIVRLVDLIMS